MKNNHYHPIISKFWRFLLCLELTIIEFTVPPFSVFYKFELSLNRCKSRQITLVWGGTHSRPAACCPTASKNAEHIQTTPKYAAQSGKQPGEGMIPFALPGDKPQQNISQQRRPYLPAYRIFIVSHEVGKLQGLFNLLEKHLDRPARLVKIANGRGRPCEIIRNESHSL